MKENPSLYHPPFQKVFASRDLSEIELKTLAEKLLSSEESVPNNAENLCHSASILYCYGMHQQKERPLLLALNKLMHAEEVNPQFFELSSVWRHLWGNILVQLSRFVNDYSFIEKALKQYAKAAEVADRKAELYWDWAEAWILLGVHSAELSDLKRGLEKFRTAANLGCDSHLFLMDYALAYVIYGMHVGEPSYLEEALSILRGVIAETYSIEGEVTALHSRAWTAYASTLKLRYSLTHLQKHFEEADTTFREAILSVPTQVDLWLEWGELFLCSGWLRHDLKAIEIGLDKLTSSKVNEGDSLRLSALLGKGLLFLGLYLEDLKLLSEGRERILAALDIAPERPELLTTAALCEFGFGIYFSDAKAYAKAAAYFEKGIEADSTSMENLHGLFLTYLNWGMIEEDPSLAWKGVQAIARVCQLRPHSPLHLNEWGVGLLQLRQLEGDLDAQHAIVEEAILKFKQAFSLHEDLETLYNWGCALDQLGDLTGGEENYEKAIEILSQLHDENPQEPHFRYHLALALSHLGELTANVESLYQAVDLYLPLFETDQEDAILWGDFGYTLLNLSELVYDPVHAERGEELRREAEKRLLHAAEVGNSDANYHLACLYSLAGLVDASIHFLKRAEAMDALPPQEDLEHDEWLANVRETDLFKEFMMW